MSLLDLNSGYGGNIVLKIRQSYQGNGGKDGYKYEVYNREYDYLGELRYFPNEYSSQDTFSINGKIYKVQEEYDSDLPHEEEDEVVYYILKEINSELTYDLGYVIKTCRKEDIVDIKEIEEILTKAKNNNFNMSDFYSFKVKNGVIYLEILDNGCPSNMEQGEYLRQIDNSTKRFLASVLEALHEYTLALHIIEPTNSTTGKYQRLIHVTKMAYEDEYRTINKTIRYRILDESDVYRELLEYEQYRHPTRKIRFPNFDEFRRNNVYEKDVLEIPFVNVLPSLRKRYDKEKDDYVLGVEKSIKHLKESYKKWEQEELKNLVINSENNYGYTREQILDIVSFNRKMDIKMKTTEIFGEYCSKTGVKQAWDL